MAFICVPREKIEKFKRDLKSRSLNIGELVKMSTEERTATLEKYVGKDAKTVNTLFEEKLILKNRLQGIKNWASKVGEVGRYDPAKKAKLDALLSEFRARQQERMFSPAEYEAFLKDLVEERFGTRISRDEAKTIFDTRAKMDAIKERGFNEATEQWNSPKEALDYGFQEAFLNRYTASLKGEEFSIKDLLKGRYSQFKQEFADNKLDAAYGLISDALGEVRDLSVSLLASVDNSFQFRQGFSVLVNRPKIWANGFLKSWGDMWQTLKGKGVDVRMAIDAEIYSRPNHVMGRDAVAKILGGKEEQFPVSLPERIPVLGRVFEASQRAFEGSALRMRLGLFDQFLEIMKKAGRDIDDPLAIKDAARLAMQMTARSPLGKTGSTLLNHYIFWAPRMIKSAWDTLTLPFSANISPFVRKQAAMNLLRMVVVIGTIKAIANAVSPGSSSVDPRSTDFKNIKVGDTRFSVGSGELAIITLASRLVPTLHNGEWGWWTVGSDGVYRKYEGEFGQSSPFDAAMKFLEGKAAPFPTRTLIDYLKQRTFTGEKPTVLSSTFGISTPISIQNAIQLGDDASVAAVLGVIGDTLGFSANTYNSLAQDWSQNPSVELKQFKEKVGDDKFKEANDTFNTQYRLWFQQATNDPRYLKLSDEDKQKLLTNKKTEIKDSVLKSYRFKYVPPKKSNLPNL